MKDRFPHFLEHLRNASQNIPFNLFAITLPSYQLKGPDPHVFNMTTLIMHNTISQPAKPVLHASSSNTVLAEDAQSHVIDLRGEGSQRSP